MVPDTGRPFSSDLVKLPGLTLIRPKCLPSPSSTSFIPEAFFNDHRTQPPMVLAQILYFLSFVLSLSIDALIICLDWIFSLPIAVNAVWESTWVVFGKVSASRRPNKGIPSL
jgi:hypothetical protein